MLTHELTTDNSRAEALADVLRDAPRVDQTSRAAAVAAAVDGAPPLNPATLDRLVTVYRAGRKAVAA